MPFLPPLIKPPPPPLRPPVSPPYRPPGTNRLPPTQTVPIYQPPDLLPTTNLDLKGVVCIYSNAPLWEPKKIRYRYPGENWQEIAGDRYTSVPEFDIVRGGQYFDTWTLVSTKGTVVREGAKLGINLRTVPNGIFSTFDYIVAQGFSFTGTFVSWQYSRNHSTTVTSDGQPSFYLIHRITYKNNN